MNCRLTFIILLFLIISALSGCGGKQYTSPKLSKTKITAKLLTQYEKWQGTPYKNGGVSLQGVDCSGFVLTTFRDQFGIVLPRETKKQAKQGEWVKRSELQAGDLVFFRTGWFTRHVGIYLKKNKFIHASSSKGVIISKLTDSYWTKRYWQARRLPLM